ncbi:unnamed protein product [Ilex paraguariensis]|uniref:Uncharacterized protein n=1 Tax=Ilex paraguariensis TaxID=185542 RepID=A0ABC8QVR9_9AQUA
MEEGSFVIVVVVVEDVHITDGIQFIKEVANFEVADEVRRSHGNEDDLCDTKPPASNGSCIVSPAEGKHNITIDILIVDVDSSDTSSGMTCPAADFVEESFLLTVKKSLSDQGLFVINLVSRSPTVKELVFSRMKMVSIDQGGTNETSRV